jgi:hypothetical protein
MHRTPVGIAAIISAATLVGGGLAGCSRSSEKAAPVAEVKEQHPAQAVNQPVTLSGCVRAGEAADTFVLTTTATKDGEAPATYQLAAAESVGLRNQIGKQVEVSGRVTAQQDTQSHAAGPAANTATGTSGSPRVETTTDVDIKRLDVSAVKPLGQGCNE